MPSDHATPFPAHCRVLAHRGDSVAFPENTMAAFESAAALGVDVIETDVHLTRDGVCVLWHDESVERNTGRPGLIAEMDWGELSGLDAAFSFSPDGGRTFPFRGRRIGMVRLKDMLVWLPRARFNIDLKARDPVLVRKFCDIVEEARATERVCAASFHHANLVQARSRLPGMSTSLSPEEVKRLIVSRFVPFCSPEKRIPSRVFQVPETQGRLRVVSPAMIRYFRRRGFEIQVWTVNSEMRMEKLIAWGVDGIFTDDPRLLLKVLGRSTDNGEKRN